ncbi:hypothetical protein QRD89_05660 [Halobacillus sp. ACCC02827]|nr:MULTISPECIES: hypothetical protein [Bacillaceae]ELK45227.1 hypothetical protein D479_15897 [Halobacillus sp. BAB-2008]WJE16834.1 hypothetical protein QRD89_05660 [Halobacillus sp. ACCC02827]
MEQQKNDNRNEKRGSEVPSFDERKLEAEKLTDADRKQMEADQHTVGGF